MPENVASSFKLVCLVLTAVSVGFDPDTYTVNEGGVASFTVVLTGEASIAVVVDFMTLDSAAVGN